jgi:anti-sigma factor RsiW
MALTPDTDTCDNEAARLLPWFVTGRIEADDAARVQAHLAGCASCRADLAEQRQWRDLMQSDEKVEYSPQPSLQTLMSRIDELDREIAPVAVASVAVPAGDVELADVSVRSSPPRWLVAAVVLQAVGLGLLGSQLWQHTRGASANAEYVTLSSIEGPAGNAPHVRVVFAADTTIDGVATLLCAVRADIVAGPTEAGAYTLALRSAPDAPASSTQVLLACGRTVCSRSQPRAGPAR